MTNDDYVEVEATIGRITAKAVQLHTDSHSVWVPRSCLYGPEEIDADTWTEGDKLVLKVRRWFAEREELY